MITMILAAILIIVLIWDLHNMHQPKGGLDVHVSWWAWTSSNVLAAVGAAFVITEHTLGYPPSENAEGLLILGVLLRVACLKFGAYRLIAP